MASYSLIMYLMLLIIYTITTENIDVYNEITMYSNTTMLTLVDLSNILFLIWIILILINKLLDFLETKGIKTKSHIIKDENEVITIEKEVIKEVPVEIIKKVEVIKEVPIQSDDVVFTKDEYNIILNILKSKIKED